MGALRDSGPPEGGSEKKELEKIKKFLTKAQSCDRIAELLEKKRKNVPCKLNNVKQTKHLKKSDFSGFQKTGGQRFCNVKSCEIKANEIS